MGERSENEPPAATATENSANNQQQNDLDSNKKTAMNSASLYVGDLHPDVTEALIYDKFSKIGPVLSIRVCRDMITRKSLGYAYVNFQSHSDAERAMDELNFEVMVDRPMRIMWSQRDPAIRKSGVGNVFIKNLDKTITPKELCDTFQQFGRILSVKISNDETGKSKGYGFVHFESEEAADSAIDKINGKSIKGKTVYVGNFIPRNERGGRDNEAKFTNCFIKNFGEDLTEEEINELFAPFGEILSAKLMENEIGKPKGFGFVSFKEAESAAKAVDALNNKELKGHVIYVGKAQKKSERVMELKHKFEKKVDKSLVDLSGGAVNLYIKNLDDEISDEELKKLFQRFGNITSAKVMTDTTGRSRGFGFVCFNDASSATQAVHSMNGSIVGSKPLYVAVAQKKEDRQAQLVNQYNNRMIGFPGNPAVTMGMQIPNNFATNPQHAAALSAAGMIRAQFQNPMPNPVSLYGNNPSAYAAMRSAANRWNPGNFAPNPSMLAAAANSVMSRNSAAVAAAMMRPNNMQHARPILGGQVAGNAGNNMMMSNGGAGNSAVGNQNGGNNGMNSAANQRPIMSNNAGNNTGSPMPPQAGSANGMYGMNNSIQGNQQQFQNMRINGGNAVNGMNALGNNPMGANNAAMMPGQTPNLPNSQPPSINHASMTIQAHVNNALSDTGMSDNDKRQVVGESLFQVVQSIEHQLAGKITGMLLDHDKLEEIAAYIGDRNVVEQKVHDALRALEGSSKQQSRIMMQSNQQQPSAGGNNVANNGSGASVPQPAGQFVNTPNETSNNSGNEKSNNNDANGIYRNKPQEIGVASGDRYC